MFEYTIKKDNKVIVTGVMYANNETDVITYLNERYADEGYQIAVKSKA